MMEQVAENLRICMRVPKLRSRPRITCAALANEYVGCVRTPLIWKEYHFDSLEALLDSVNGLQVYECEGESCVRLVRTDSNAVLEREQQRKQLREQEQERQRKLERERERNLERERQRKQLREQEQERQRELELQRQRDIERAALQADATEAIVELVRVAAERLSMPLRPANLAESFDFFYKRPFPLHLFGCDSAADVAVELALSGRLTFDAKRCLHVAALKAESVKSSASLPKRELSLPAEVKKRLLCMAYNCAGLPVLMLPDKYREKFRCQLPSFSSMGCSDLLDLLRRIPGIVLMKNPIDPDRRISIYGTRLPNQPKAAPFPSDCVPPGYRLPIERLRRPQLPADLGEVDARHLLQRQYDVLVPLASNSGPSRFFVIPFGEVSNRLDNLMEQLDAAQHPPLPELFARPGQLCVAVTEQGARRVRIAGPAADGAAKQRLVEDVDYGELLTVDLASLRCLHRRFAEGVAAHAILCRLAFLRPNGGADRFDQLAVDMFRLLTKDVLLKLTVDLEPPPAQSNFPYSVHLSGVNGSFLDILFEKSLGVLPIQLLGTDVSKKFSKPLTRLSEQNQYSLDAPGGSCQSNSEEAAGTDAEAGSNSAEAPISEADDFLDEDSAVELSVERPPESDYEQTGFQFGLGAKQREFEFTFNAADKGGAQTAHLTTHAVGATGGNQWPSVANTQPATGARSAAFTMDLNAVSFFLYNPIRGTSHLQQQ